MNRDRGGWCGRAVTVVGVGWLEAEVVVSDGGGCK